MIVRVNKGFLIAFERQGVEKLCEAMRVKKQTIYNIRNGKTQLSLNDAAMLSYTFRIAFNNFRQWEEVAPAGLTRREK